MPGVRVKTLTVEILRSLPFVFNMHMRGTKFARTSKINQEWDLVILTDIARPGYKVEAVELQHVKGEAAVELTGTQTDDQYQQRLAEFCEAYNREQEGVND